MVTRHRLKKMRPARCHGGGRDTIAPGNGARLAVAPFFICPQTNHTTKQLLFVSTREISQDYPTLHGRQTVLDQNRVPACCSPVNTRALEINRAQSNRSRPLGLCQLLASLGEKECTNHSTTFTKGPPEKKQGKQHTQTHLQ